MLSNSHGIEMSELDVIIDEKCLVELANQFLAHDMGAIRSDSICKINLLCQHFLKKRMPYIEPSYIFDQCGRSFVCTLEFLGFKEDGEGLSKSAAKLAAADKLVEKLDTSKCSMCKMSPADYFGLRGNKNHFTSITECNEYFLKNTCICEWIRCRPAVTRVMDNRKISIVQKHAARNLLNLKQLSQSNGAASSMINGFNSSVEEIINERTIVIDGYVHELPVLRNGLVAVCEDMDGLTYAEGIPESWFLSGDAYNKFTENLRNVRICLRNQDVSAKFVTGPKPFRTTYDHFCLFSAQAYTFITTQCVRCKNCVHAKNCNNVRHTISPDCMNLRCKIIRNCVRSLVIMSDKLLKDLRFTRETAQAVSRSSRVPVHGAKTALRGAAFMSTLTGAFSHTGVEPSEQNEHLDLIRRVPRASVFTVDVDTYFIRTLLFTILAVLLFLSVCACYLCFWCRKKDSLRGRTNTLVENIVDRVNDKIVERTSTPEVRRGSVDSIVETEPLKAPRNSIVSSSRIEVIERHLAEEVSAVIGFNTIDGEHIAKIKNVRVYRDSNGELCEVGLNDVSPWFYDYLVHGDASLFVGEEGYNRHFIMTEHGFGFSLDFVNKYQIDESLSTISEENFDDTDSECSELKSNSDEVKSVVSAQRSRHRRQKSIVSLPLISLALISVFACGGYAWPCGDEADEIKNLRKEIYSTRAVVKSRDQKINILNEKIRGLENEVAQFEREIDGLHQEERTHQMELSSCMDHLDSSSVEDVRKKIRWDRLTKLPSYSSYWKMNTLSIWLAIVCCVSLIIALLTSIALCVARKKHKEGKRNAYGKEEMAKGLVQSMFEYNQAQPISKYAIETEDMDYQV